MPNLQLDNLNTIPILGININAFKRNDIDEILSSLLSSSKPVILTTPNAEIVMQAKSDDELAEIINNESSLNLADGIGLLWAAKFSSLKVPDNLFYKPLICIQWLLTLVLIPLCPKYFHKPIPERISGADFTWDLAKYASNNNLKIFLLGGAPTVAERCALELQTNLPDLRIGGVFSGPASEVNKAIDAIRKSRSDILLVAFGAPKQEKWLGNNLNKTGCKLGIGVGGTFDFIAGVKKRAPQFIRKIGLEWLYRLILEPKRFLRQMALPRFAYFVLVEKLKKRKIND